MLMLIVMSYNPGVFLSLLFGYFLGDLAFAHEFEDGYLKLGTTTPEQCC